MAANDGNGGVKNKTLKNGSILTEKMYDVLIYKRKQHIKNHVDFIENEVTGEV